MINSDLKVKTATDQIVEHVMKAIFKGEFTAGSKLKETYISQWLGVSRTPVREALRILEHKGLVEFNSNKGSRVKDISKADLFDLYEARIIIELQNLHRIIYQLQERDINHLADILNNSSTALKSKDYLQYFILALDFHQYLLERGGNKWLLKIFYSLRPTLNCAQIHCLKNPQRLEDSLNEHKSLLTALKDQDKDKSLKLLKNLLCHSYQRMMNQPYAEDIFTALSNFAA